MNAVANFALGGLWVVPAVAQQPAATGDWTRLPPKELIFSQEALKFSYGEIERMRDDELEAFRQMLATCSTKTFFRCDTINPNASASDEAA